MIRATQCTEFVLSAIRSDTELSAFRDRNTMQMFLGIFKRPVRYVRMCFVLARFATVAHPGSWVNRASNLTPLRDTECKSAGQQWLIY